MSMDAIAAVTQAEAEARRLKAEAAAEVRRAAAAAEAAGRDAVEAALAKAAAELAEYRAKAAEAADSAEKELRFNTENLKTEIRSAAEAKLGQASDLIVERIVGR